MTNAHAPEPAVVHAGLPAPEPITPVATPVFIRKLYREYKRKPDVYGSRFDLATPLEARALDERKLRVVGVELKEGCHPGRTCVGHVYVNWALASGAYSVTTYAYGGPIREGAALAEIERAFLAGVGYLEGLPDRDTEPGPAL